MHENKLKRERVLIIDKYESKEIYALCFSLLMDFMYDSNALNKEVTEYFSIRTRNSAKSSNSKEMILEWVVYENNGNKHIIKLDEEK